VPCCAEAALGGRPRTAPRPMIAMVLSKCLSQKRSAFSLSASRSTAQPGVASLGERAPRDCEETHIADKDRRQFNVLSQLSNPALAAPISGGRRAWRQHRTQRERWRGRSRATIRPSNSVKLRTCRAGRASVNLSRRTVANRTASAIATDLDSTGWRLQATWRGRRPKTEEGRPESRPVALFCVAALSSRDSITKSNRPSDSRRT
jgi:hypothetical protein